MDALLPIKTHKCRVSLCSSLSGKRQCSDQLGTLAGEVNSRPLLLIQDECPISLYAFFRASRTFISSSSTTCHSTPHPPDNDLGECTSQWFRHRRPHTGVDNFPQQSLLHTSTITLPRIPSGNHERLFTNAASGSHGIQYCI